MDKRRNRPIRHIVLVRVERALPLISPAYDQGKTEDEVRDLWLRYWEVLYHHRGEGTTVSDGV